ncbi:hypothetical protein GCM10010250_17690 [Streptomyces althioticus]|nr:hypothetical protein GCM10010250_17690 [Streptomyces althioticus]GGT51277.1 hypothetical protein GCM10010243_31770 [Streptomyces matensis]
MFRLQDAQRAPHGLPLDAELGGQLRLRGHALTRPQHPGPDPGAQLVGHFTMRPLWPLWLLPSIDGGVFRLHGQTLQLLAILREFNEGWL